MSEFPSEQAAPDAFNRPQAPDLDPTEPGATVLDLEQMLSQIKMPEGTAEFCYRGDLLADWDEAVKDLARYVDDKGEALDEDTSLAEGDPAFEAAARVADIEKQIAAHQYRVRFRAMPKAKWTTFTTKHTDAKGNFKPEFPAELVARCAIEPTITLEQAKRMEAELHPAAFIVLQNRAFNLNRFDGVAIPKSSSSSALLRQQESSPS